MRSAALLIVSAVMCGCSGHQDDTTSHQTSQAAVAPTNCYSVSYDGGAPREWGDGPVCRAVLDNMNKFCSDGPQYDRRLLHASSTQLHLPAWVAIAPSEALVKQVWLAGAPSEHQERWWQEQGEDVLRRFRVGELKMFRYDATEDDATSSGYLFETVFRLEAPPDEPQTGYKQPRLMLSEFGKEVPSDMFPQFHMGYMSDLWRLGDSWFSIYALPVGKEIRVTELRRNPGSDRVDGALRCTIRHKDEA